jgi:hypothetical protein
MGELGRRASTAPLRLQIRLPLRTGDRVDAKLVQFVSYEVIIKVAHDLDSIIVARAH